jgi:polysaccharide biosynthesis/export protein
MRRMIPNRVWTGVLLLNIILVFTGKEFAQQQSQNSDISPSTSSVPGMEKTTTFKGIKIGGEGAASSITPAATGRNYPASGQLLIGVGDLLHISVFETPEFDQDSRVDPGGIIDVAGLGTLGVENRQPRDVAAEIQNKLRNAGIMLDPKVTVTITDYISHGVSIQGEVRSPGIYPVLGQRRLSDLITACGGPTELSDGTADIRHPSSPMPEHILLAQGAETYTIVPGDIISLHRAPLVYILGNVRRAGGFPLARRTTISEGIALAQGFSPSAKDKKAYLFRDSGGDARVVVVLNLHKILRGEAGDIVMKPNDVLFVPNSSVADIAKAAATVLPALGTAEIYTHP